MTSPEQSFRFALAKTIQEHSPGTVGLPVVAVAKMQRDAKSPAWIRTLVMNGYPADTPLERVLDAFYAWRDAGRSAGLSGCGTGCGCSSCAGLSGLGSISPTIVRKDKKGKNAVLTVRNYLTSLGPLDPLRQVTELGGALTSMGYAISRPLVEVYPLTWSWEYDGPSKVYQAKVVGAVSGPFVRATEGIGPTSTGTPTAEDAQNLPSVGTVISFKNVKLPANADLNALLGVLRSAKVTAARGSNATDSGQLELEVVSSPNVAGKVALGFAGALVGFFLLRGSKALENEPPVF